MKKPIDREPWRRDTAEASKTPTQTGDNGGGKIAAALWRMGPRAIILTMDRVGGPMAARQ